MEQQQPSRSIAVHFVHIAIATPHLLFAASACVDLPEEDTVVSSATVSNDQQYTNSLGTAATYTTAGSIDLGGRFAIGFTAQEQADLLAFLQSL